jgi:hypothetical protein
MSSGSHLAQVQWQPRILRYKERCRVTLDPRLRMFTLYILLAEVGIPLMSSANR